MLKDKINNFLYPMDKIYKEHKELKEIVVKRDYAEECYMKYYKEHIAPLIREEKTLRKELLAVTTKEKEIIEPKIDVLVEKRKALESSNDYCEKQEKYQKCRKKCLEYIRGNLTDKEQNIVYNFGNFEGLSKKEKDEGRLYENKR